MELPKHVGEILAVVAIAAMLGGAIYAFWKDDHLCKEFYGPEARGYARLGQCKVGDEIKLLY